MNCNAQLQLGPSRSRLDLEKLDLEVLDVARSGDRRSIAGRAIQTPGARCSTKFDLARF